MNDFDQPAVHYASRETVRQSIVLSFVKAWIDLPPGPGNLLGTVLPILDSRDTRQDQAIRLGTGAVGNDDPDAQRAAWKELKTAAVALHQTPVRHNWYRWNPETEKEQLCTADLVWTTEVRDDPVARQIELVFWPCLGEYLPEILGRMAGYKTRALASPAALASDDGLTDFFHNRQG